LRLRRGKSSIFVITNLSPSTIPWCSPPGVSNSFVGVTPWFLPTFSFQNLTRLHLNLNGIWTSFTWTWKFLNLCQVISSLIIFPTFCHEPQVFKFPFKSFPKVIFLYFRN
jgi:hypothetical protein